LDLPNSIKASLRKMKLLLSQEFLKQSQKLKTKKKKTPAKNAKLTTFGIQSQIIRHIKEAQNTVYMEEKNQSIEVGLEITQMIELVNRYLKQFLGLYSICSRS